MTTLEIDVGDLHARAVEFTATELVVTLADGLKIATPLDWSKGGEHKRWQDGAAASATG